MPGNSETMASNFTFREITYPAPYEEPGPVDAPLPQGNQWFAEDACTFAFYDATTPPAFYDSVANTTWLAYEGWNGVTRLLRVCTYNHTTGVWAGPYTAIVSPMVNDDHGVPSMCMDADGHVHIFGCSHNTPIYRATTLNPRDPSAWSAATTPLGSGTYAHGYLINGALYVFLRDANKWLLKMFKTTALTNGTPTFAAPVTVGSMGSPARWYQGNGVVVGTDIHMVATWADQNDTIRQDVYYLIYNTLTGSVRNFDGSVTVAAVSLPVSRATLNASFRLINQTAGGTGGTVPQLVIASGVSHVAYMDGSGTTYKAYHICNDGSGWTSPLEIGAFASNNVSHRYDGLTITPTAIAGDVDLWWCAAFGSFGRGGKIVKRTRHANGALSAQVDVKSPDRTFTLDPVVMVKDGHPDIRAIFAESSSSSTLEQQLRVYVAGDRGIVERAIA